MFLSPLKISEVFISPILKVLQDEILTRCKFSSCWTRTDQLATSSDSTVAVASYGCHVRRFLIVTSRAKPRGSMSHGVVCPFALYLSHHSLSTCSRLCQDDPDTHLVPNPLPGGQVEDQLGEVAEALHSCFTLDSLFQGN